MGKSGKGKGRSPSSADPSAPNTVDDGSAIAKLRAVYPQLTSATRNAYRSLATDAQRASLGEKTKSEAVLKEGTGWAVIMSNALKKAAVADHYSTQRFAFFLENLDLLDTQVRLERNQLQGTNTVRASAKATHASALELREKLAGRLRRFAGKREELLTRIDSAQGRADSDENLATGLKALANLTEEWLAQKDEKAQFLLKDAGVTQPRADEARLMAKQLLKKGTAAVLAGRIQLRDSAAVNVLEGGVLLEMQNAMRAFADARLDDPAVPNLSPGAGTRSVLSTHSKPASKSKPEDASKKKAAAGKDTKSAGKDVKSTGKDAKSAGKDAKSAGKDAELVGKDAKSTGKDAGSTGKDGSDAGEDS